MILCFLILSTTYLFSQNNKITWSSFNMGYGENLVTSFNLKVKSIAGQVFIGTVKKDNRQIICGFLADTLWRSMPVEVEQVNEMPSRFLLDQNYPNPFNPTTTIHFELPIVSYVTLRVFNLLGQEVATLVDENKPAGKYDVKFNGENLPSGVYFYQLTTCDQSTKSLSYQFFKATKKLLLLK